MQQSTKRKIFTLLLSLVCLISSACALTPSDDTTRSILSTTINSSGELVITYSDGTTDNLGKVTGSDGSAGTDGKDGKSAYELYCEKYSYTGSEEEWLNSLLNGTLSQDKVEQVKPNLTISVLGASSSTKEDRNAVEIIIGAKDVGVELSAYPTYYDIGTTIGGYTIAKNDIGKELTFTPVQSDIGKTIGNPKNYNESEVKVWWEHVEDYFNCTVNPVCWSGSSYTSWRADDDTTTSAYLGYATSHSWHDSQIRRLGIRVEGSMKRVAPDIIILHRGINDMTKRDDNGKTFTTLTEGYFDNPNWQYPTTDKLADGSYGIKEALALTIKKIRDAYPTTKIVLSTITTMQRGTNGVNYGDNIPTNNGVYSAAQLNAAIRETADFFGCPMIDFDQCGITYENGVDEGYLKSDRTHPTSKGHALIGKQAINDLLYKAYLDVNDYISNTPPTVVDPTPADPTFVDMGEVLEGYGVESTSGNLVENARFFAYDMIPVEPFSTYYANLARTVAVLDKDGNIITFVSTNDFKNNGYKIKIPENGAYLRICSRYADFEDWLTDFKLIKVVE